METKRSQAPLLGHTAQIWKHREVRQLAKITQLRSVSIKSIKRLPNLDKITELPEAEAQRVYTTCLRAQDSHVEVQRGQSTCL